MDKFDFNNKYEKIIEFLCFYSKINKEELMEIMKDRELKYLLFLLLKKYRCADEERIGEDFFLKSRKSIKYNLRKAEEKFFINKEFREKYFEMEELIDKII